MTSVRRKIQSLNRLTLFSNQLLSASPSSYESHDDVIIVGAGTAGLSAFIHQIKEAEKCNVKNFSIRIIEKNPIVGAGRPWYPTQDYVLHVNDLNADMIIIADQCDDFENWLRSEFVLRHPELAEARAKEIAEDENFAPRPQFGMYCLDRFQDYLQKAKNLGITVNIENNTEIVRHVKNHSCWNLLTNNGKVFHADNLILTVGHLPSDRLQHLRAHPQAKQRVISPLKDEFHKITWDKQRVFIAGTGLTTIDTVNKLRNHTGPITAISPSGHLPRVKNPPASDSYKLKHLTAEKLLAQDSLTLDYVLTLLAEEMSAASHVAITKDDMLRIARKTGNDPIKTLKIELAAVAALQIRDWHRALTKAFFDILPVLNQRLNAEDQKEFMSTYYPLYLKWMAAMTAKNGHKILPELQSGRLKLLKGRDEEITFDEKSNVFVLAQVGKPLIADYVIDGVGTGRDPEKHLLLTSLIKSGDACVNPNGGIKISAQCRVEAKNGKFHVDCWGYGPFVLGSDYASYSVERGAICGKDVAEQVIARIALKHVLTTGAASSSRFKSSL